MTILAILFYIGWKVIKRTSFKDPREVDLVWERPVIDAYEATTTDPVKSFWEEMGGLFFIRKQKTHNEEIGQ